MNPPRRTVTICKHAKSVIYMCVSAPVFFYLRHRQYLMAPVYDFWLRCAGEHVFVHHARGQCASRDGQQKANCLHVRTLSGARGCILSYDTSTKEVESRLTTRMKNRKDGLYREHRQAWGDRGGHWSCRFLKRANYTASVWEVRMLPVPQLAQAHRPCLLHQLPAPAQVHADSVTEASSRQISRQWQPFLDLL